MVWEKGFLDEWHTFKALLLDVGFNLIALPSLCNNLGVLLLTGSSRAQEA